MNYILDFRGANVGGPVVPGRIVHFNDLQNRLDTEQNLRLELKVTFLLHGYNVNRDQGKVSLLELAQKLPSAQDGAIVAVLWPGDHWTQFASYPFEGKDADDTAAELARYIELILRPGAEISFVSHSLGARVVMETVNRLVGGDYPIRQICLMAAAVDDYSLAYPSDYQAAVNAANRVAVLASRQDRVLKYAYPAGDLLQSFLIFRNDTFGLALGYHGPKPIQGHPVPGQVYHQQIPDDRKADHNHYLPIDASNNDQLANQLAAARFANEVLQGTTTPTYLP